MHNYSVIIPCAGFGSRLYSSRPKSLIEFDDEDFLFQKQLAILNKSLDNPEITFIGGFQYNKIEKKIKEHANLIYNPYYEKMNVAYSIAMGMGSIKTDNCLVVYGDLFFNKNIMSLITGSGSNSFLVTDRQNLDSDEVGLWCQKESVARLDYTLPIKWGQIAYFKKSEKEAFIDNVFSKKNGNKLGFEILNSLIEAGHIFDVIETDESCTLVDIDSQKDIVKINDML